MEIVLEIMPEGSGPSATRTDAYLEKVLDLSRKRKAAEVPPGRRSVRRQLREIRLRQEKGRIY